MNNVTRREWIEVMGEGTDAQKLWEGMLDVTTLICDVAEQLEENLA